MFSSVKQIFAALNPHFPPSQIKALYQAMPKVVGARQRTAQGNTTTTMANTELAVTLEPGKAYAIKVVSNTTIPVTQGIKIDFDGSTIDVSSFFAVAKYYAGASAVESDVVTAIDTDLATVVAATSFQIDGFIAVGAGGGTLTLRFAQQAGPSGTVTLPAGSYLIATELP